MMNRPTSPLLNKYQAIYRKNPNSRVFAPLAETYRKLGMITEAINLLNEGIRKHPSYLLGYITLGNCYYDLKKFELAYSTLRPFVEDNRDNLSLQKLFAKVCEHIDKLEEALDTYKFLLYINPKDYSLVRKVDELESQNSYTLLPPESDQKFEIKRLDQGIDFFADADDWVQVNLNEELNESRPDKEIQKLETELVADPINDEDPIEESLEIIEEKPSFQIENLNTQDDGLDQNQENEAPILTHTLVDLYLSQGHADKAYEVLQKILALNPESEKTIQKLTEVKKQIDDETEDDGRDRLMEAYDQKFPLRIETENSDSSSDMDRSQLDKLEQVLDTYLSLIKERASTRQ